MLAISFAGMARSFMVSAKQAVSSTMEILYQVTETMMPGQI